MKWFFPFAILVCAATSTVARQANDADSPTLQRVAHLKTGQYFWDETGTSTGPLLLVINLSTQRALLFRNGVPIAGSTISTGSEGRETPLGMFTVLQKAVFHRSRTYDNAPMPFMQRLTEKGVAMHAGDLPGYPASHGCIRLPHGFAKRLFAVTVLGTPVKITDEEQERLAAEYRRASEEVARTKADLVENAQRAMAEYDRARNAHEELLRKHRALMANQQPGPDPK